MAYDNYQDKNKAQALQNVVNWALTDGQKFSQELGYVPLPAKVVNKVQAEAKKISS